MTKLNLFFVALFASVTIFSSAQLPYQNHNLKPHERAVDLVARMTLEEKVHMMVDVSKPVERLGIKSYNWWNEALHGVARAGIATVFPQPIGLSATFDPEHVFDVFTAISDEARAKNTQFALSGDVKRYQGLTMWTPNINILRDPRWGRGIETYGEDPYLTAEMGVAVVKALQGSEDAKYNKLHACAKHYAVHSGPEWNRHSFNAANIKSRDLHETYLPAFKKLVQQANVKEVMCAYNRFEGEPCCGSKQLLNNILRNDWGFDGIVVADCGAIADFYKQNAHATHPDAATASADAVLSGTDLDCGSSYRSLLESVKLGLISESDIDVSVIRLLKARFELGEMDDPELVAWTKIPYSVVASPKHDSLAYLSALKSMTLLMNKNKILPLKKSGLKIAVMGPNANDSVMQWGNYNGTPPRTITILDGIKQIVGDDNVIYEKGCDLVERTMFVSLFDNCVSPMGKGFAASYWNNSDFSGPTVIQNQISNPFSFCTSGATVFAPGVNLTDFSASYSSTFTPKTNGEVYLDFYYCGAVRIFIDNKEVKNFRSNHGARIGYHKFNVVSGQSYDIRIDFSYSMGDAQLNFDLGFKQDINMRQSISNVQSADVVVFVGGISPAVEGEEMGVNLPGFRGGDRTDIELPAVQRELIAQLHKAGKKVVFVNCSGSSIGLLPEIENCEAILQAWYPGQSGGKAVADVLFGNQNPAGKLPVTFYKNVDQLPDFEDYNMSGRTYRYFTGEALFPFGFGLSYADINIRKARLTKLPTQSNKFRLVVPVRNNSKINGEEVVQVYLNKTNDVDGPLKSLVAFKRVSVPAGKVINVEFDLDESYFEWWDQTNSRMAIVPGNYQLMVGNSSSDSSMCAYSIDIE